MLLFQGDTPVAASSPFTSSTDSGGTCELQRSCTDSPHATCLVPMWRCNTKRISSGKFEGLETSENHHTPLRYARGSKLRVCVLGMVQHDIALSPCCVMCPAVLCASVTYLWKSVCADAELADCALADMLADSYDNELWESAGSLLESSPSQASSNRAGRAPQPALHCTAVHADIAQALHSK